MGSFARVANNGRRRNLTQFQLPGANKAKLVICDHTIERSFAWIGRYRRMSKDYVYLIESSEAMIYLTMIRLMLKRLAANSHMERRARRD